MTAKEYLGKIKKIDTQIRNKSIECKQLEELGCDSLTGSIRTEREQLVQERQRIIATIEKLQEADYDVLHMVYVQHMTLQEAAAKRDISYSLVATIHGRALKRLENIMNTS